MQYYSLKEVIQALRSAGENEMADSLNQGGLTLPWRSEDGTYTVEQPIYDLLECGTPIDENDGSDCVLDLPVEEI